MRGVQSVTNRESLAGNRRERVGDRTRIPASRDNTVGRDHGTSSRGYSTTSREHGASSRGCSTTGGEYSSSNRRADIAGRTCNEGNGGRTGARKKRSSAGTERDTGYEETTTRSRKTTAKRNTAKRKKRATQLRYFYILPIAFLLALILVITFSCREEEHWEPPSLAIEKEPPRANTYDTAAFRRENGFLYYDRGRTMMGIDVSTHQGVVDWQAVKAAGVEFVILRAGYRGSTVGDLYEDDVFFDYLEQAREADLLVGAYFFSQALDAYEAREEAQFVCDLLDGAELDLPVYYDWEQVSGESRVTDIDAIPMTQCALAFCQEVEAAGYAAGVYFNQSYGNHYLDLKALEDYHLWLAEYNETPTFPYHFDCLQYSDRGTIPGIEVPVDLDLLFLPDSGSEEEP